MSSSTPPLHTIFNWELPSHMSVEGWIPALTLSCWVSRGFCPETEAAEVVYLVPTSGPLSLHYASSKWKISSRFGRPDWEWRDRSCRGRNLKQFGITSHILIWVMLPTTAGIIKRIEFPDEAVCDWRREQGSARSFFWNLAKWIRPDGISTYTYMHVCCAANRREGRASSLICPATGLWPS